MTFEGVPWMVDEADHTAEVGRLLAYAATGGGEGVIGPADCKVVASAIPDNKVLIDSGGLAILNRFPGGGQQTYVARNVGATEVALDPQGSAGVRYDLVAVVVEDPEYPGQPAPATIEDGPYVRAKVYKDVGPTASTLQEVDPDQSGYVLARVKFDASDGTINPVDITDLRELAQPRTKREILIANISGESNIVSPTFIQWSNGLRVVSIPAWATRLKVMIHVTGAIHSDPDVQGFMRIRVSDDVTLVGPWIAYVLDDTDSPLGFERFSTTLAMDVDITSLAGSDQGIFIEAKRDGGAGYIGTSPGQYHVYDVEFTESPV